MFYFILFQFEEMWMNLKLEVVLKEEDTTGLIYSISQ